MAAITFNWQSIVVPAGWDLMQRKVFSADPLVCSNFGGGIKAVNFNGGAAQIILKNALGTVKDRLPWSSGAGGRWALRATDGASQDGNPSIRFMDYRVGSDEFGVGSKLEITFFGNSQDGYYDFSIIAAVPGSPDDLGIFFVRGTGAGTFELPFSVA
jgi:hypothetical protein